MNKFVISLSPHVHSGDSVQKNMYSVCLALLPSLLCSLWYFGLGAAIVLLNAVVFCVLAEWFISKFILGRDGSSITDGSAIVTGLLLGFNLPANLPLWIIAIGAIVAIGIGKMTFGGLGQNPFNPALVGRVFLLISFPVQMTTWPIPGQLTAYTDALTAATPLALASEGKINEIPGATDLLLGNMGGSLGEVSAIALLIGFAFLLWKKVITWHIPVSIVGTVAVLSCLFWISNPESYLNPLQTLLTGGLMLGAFFMATDYATSPMTHKGQLIYGVSIGFITLLIRYWGAYPEGLSFAILIMNAFTPLINTYCKPKRFGAK